MKPVKIKGSETKWAQHECENLKFIYFLNKDFLPEYFINMLDIGNTCRLVAIGEKVFQNLYLGSSFNFIRSINFFFEFFIYTESTLDICLVFFVVPVTTVFWFLYT